MGQDITREANSSSASQEILGILLNSKVHYHVHASTPLIPTLSQMIPVHNLPSYFFTIQFNITLISTSKCSSWFRSLGLSNRNPYEFFFFFMQATFRLSRPPWFHHPRANNLAPQYEISSRFLIFSPCLAQISSSAPYSLFLSASFKDAVIAKVIWHQCGPG